MITLDNCPGCVVWRRMPSLEAERARVLAQADDSRMVLDQIDAMLMLMVGSLSSLEPNKPEGPLL